MTNKPEPQDVREAYYVFLDREKLCATTPTQNMWKAFQAGHASALAQSDAQPVAHGEPIPDCPTEGIAARQGNGG